MSVSDGDIIQQVIEFVQPSGDLVQNKFTWEYSGAGYSDENIIGGLDSWAEDFYELLDDQIVSAVTSFTSEYDLIEWNSTLEVWEIARNIGQGSGNVTMVNASELLPYQCAACLVGFTSKPKSRGRKFLGLFGEDQQVNSTFGSAAVTALAAALAEYITMHILATNHDVYPGVASKKWGIFLPFLSGAVQNIVFTQRRRTRGRGA